MAMQFKELKQYLSRIVRISVCFEDGHYENYTLPSDIPEGRYDELYVYGVGMIDVEFPLDVYVKPPVELSEWVKVSEFFLGAGLEVVVRDRPRDDVDRHDEDVLRFRDLKGFLQQFGGFAIVRREDWSYETYELLQDIPLKYDGLYVYGIGMEDNQKAMEDPMLQDMRVRGIEIVLAKRMVLVLSETPRQDIVWGGCTLCVR